MHVLTTLLSPVRAMRGAGLLLALAAFLAALPLRAAEIDVRLGYYGTMASGNLFRDGDTLESVYGESSLTILVTDNLGGHRFQSNGTGTCPGSGNAFCFDIVIQAADGREIDRIRNATSDWQVKTSNVTDGFAVEDPLNPGFGFFLVLPNRVNPVTGSAGRYTIRGSSDPFEADDANAVVTFQNPPPTITAPGTSTGSGTSSLTITENTAAAGTFTASAAVTWTLSGTDAALFSISAGGALSFRQAPDFETARDADRNNTHIVTVTGTDAAGNAVSHTITVTVANALEGRISGTVTDRSGAGVASAQVRLISGGSVVATTTADGAGSYAFTGLASGTYSLEFLPRAGKAVKARNQQGRMNGRFTEGIVISAEQAITNADAILIDPAGVIYDSQTRQPMANVAIALYRNGTLVPDSQLDTVGGGANPQTTSASGDYSFILNGTASSGTYTLVVTPPSGYAFASTAIPPTAASYTPSLGGGIEAIQTQSTAPQVGDDPEYYLAFNFTITSDLATSSNGVVNNHIPLDPSTATLTSLDLTAAPALITADGVTTSTLTIRLKDQDGNAYTASGGTLTLQTTAGTLGPVTDNGDGTYTATLTSATTAGPATVTASLASTPAISDTASVTFTAGPASPATSDLSAGPTAIAADGTSTSTITFRLKDANGNALTTGGATVTFATTAGTLGPVTDNGDGTYTATLTSATQAGPATITATLNAAPVTDTATVTFTAGVADLAASTITANPTQIAADGTTTSTITVRLKDANGNDLTSSGGTVTLDTPMGTLGPVTDNGDGTYTATLTSSTQAGTAVITGKLDSRDLTDTASVVFQDTTPASLTGPDGSGGTVTDQDFALSLPERTTAVTRITASEGIQLWSLSGPDAARLAIASDGTVTFTINTDFETPADADSDNVYEVVIEALDLAGNLSQQTLRITVTDLPLPGQPVIGLGDRDGDGVDDSVESPTADRDGDGIPDSEDYDPQGYFYCAADGRILTGGTVSVTGPGTINMVKDGSATGEYQWFVDRPGTYVMTIDTSGMDFQTLAEPSAGTYILANGTTDPIILGATEDAATGTLGEFNGAPHDPSNLTTYYTTFVIAEGDAYVFGNNIPFADCAVNGATINATANGREPDEAGSADVEFTVTLDRAAPVDTVVDYTLSGTATEGADYAPLPGSLTIPAGQTTATITAPVMDDDQEEGTETVDVTLTALQGDSATVLTGTPSATAVISDDLMDEVASAVKSVLQEDLGQTMARQSRQFSALAKGALTRLQDPASTETCGTVQPFDVQGSADAGATGLNATGTFGDEVYDCATGIRRLSYGDFSLTDSADLGRQGMLSFGFARERQQADRISGRFWGGYLTQSRVQAGGTTGDILGAGINAGVYGARELRDGLFLDWYGAAGIGHHRYDLRVNGTMDATGGYSYAALYAGVALSGTREFGAVTVRPRAGFDLGYAIASDSKVHVTGAGGADDGVIQLDPTRGLRVYLEATISHDNATGDAQPANFRSFELTPLLFCEDGFGLRAADCGAGLGLSFKTRNAGEGIDWDYGIDVETTGQTQRLSLRIERRHEVFGGRGTVTTGLQASEGGQPVLHHGLDLRF